jgi:hypothetical protein
MRDEGMFLLEWLAFHQVIGFERIVICSNDCSDGSDVLLDSLAEGGVLTHIRNVVPAGGHPQQIGLALAFDHLAGTEAEWLCHLDADEFLNIGLGKGHITDLLAVAGKGDVIALPWRLFGDAGHQDWPGATLPKFLRCETAPDPETISHKSIYRFRRFEAATDHMPIRPRIDNPQVCNAVGFRLQNAVLMGGHHIRFHPAGRVWRPRAACINHYAIRSTDCFRLRDHRGRGWHADQGGKYALNGHWHRRANRNEGKNTAILRHWPATLARLVGLRALPGVAAAEAACVAWFQDAKAQLPALQPVTGAY